MINKDLLEKLESERQRALAEKKKWKEQVISNAMLNSSSLLTFPFQMKALETPEEKRKRRLLKKEEKEKKRKEQMGWDSELLHYTNTDNPFGDSNLLDKFIWRKKLEKEGMKSLQCCFSLQVF